MLLKDLLCLKDNDLENYYGYNLTLKKYSDNFVKAKKTSFINIKGYYRENKHNGTMSEEELEEKSKKYLKQVRTNIIDLGYNNKEKFDYFSEKLYAYINISCFCKSYTKSP